MKNQLRKYREETGLTQEELAHKMGVSVFVVSKIEQGTRIPRIPEALALAQTLSPLVEGGCTVEDLFPSKRAKARSA